jgi:hypothetical protein
MGIPDGVAVVLDLLQIGQELLKSVKFIGGLVHLALWTTPLLDLHESSSPKLAYKQWRTLLPTPEHHFEACG